MSQNTTTLLQNLGLTIKQSEIFLLLYQYGAKPASSIAKMMGGERTNVYKGLQTMVRMGLVAETNKSGIKYFFVADKNILRNRIEQKKEDILQQESILPILETELAKLDQQRISPIPKMRFFEGKQGVENLFLDIIQYVRSKNYMVIKLFASNTLESQSATDRQLHDYAKGFFDELGKEQVRIEGYLGNGILMLESLFKTYNIDELHTLPAGNSAVNIGIVGDVVFLIIFKDIPFGLKIESEELAGVFHFLLKQACKG